MKVTRTSAEAFEKRSKYIKANTGCDKCPCCHKPVSPSLISRTWTEGLFRLKVMTCNVYRCDNCGAEWESDPYEY